jgi:hypothetical protein
MANIAGRSASVESSARTDDAKELVLALSTYAATDWQRLRSDDDDRLDRTEFRKLFTCAKSALRQSDLQVARELLVSVPTVEGWAKGDFAPHPIGRRTYLRALADVVQKRLNVYAYA